MAGWVRLKSQRQDLRESSMIIRLQICFALEDNTSLKTLKDQRDEISIASENRSQFRVVLGTPLKWVGEVLKGPI
jgi:hypothetical protein